MAVTSPHVAAEATSHFFSRGRSNTQPSSPDSWTYGSARMPKLSFGAAQQEALCGVLVPSIRRTKHLTRDADFAMSTRDGELKIILWIKADRS